jgi:hypothetical protein
MLGVLVTVVVQSSSTSTSIMVGLVAAGAPVSRYYISVVEILCKSFGTLSKDLPYQILIHFCLYTDIKEKKIFLIYKEIQCGIGCKVIYEEGLLNI